MYLYELCIGLIKKIDHFKVNILIGLKIDGLSSRLVMVIGALSYLCRKYKNT